MSLRYPYFILFLLFFACQKTDRYAAPNLEAPDPAQLDAFIRENVEQTGQFLWEWASNEQVWTAIANTDYVMSVGYRPAGAVGVEDRLHLIDIAEAEWLEARQKVLDMTLASERRLNPSLKEADLFAFEENGVLPVMNLYVRNPETIALLRASDYVRYAEPTAYEPYCTQPKDRSGGSGCGGNTPEYGLSTPADYLNIAPGCKQSWNHAYHNIAQAWGNSTGSGVSIAYIDTGASDDQENLGQDFAQGYSAGRYIEKYVTLPKTNNGPNETPNDLCGHGTSMIGAGAAPRGSDGAAVGIAYGANVVSIRAAADVYLDESREVTGVSNAFVLAGNHGGVRIISMSMGRINSSSQISDAVKFAYGKNKMIFCAAGTSFWWSAWFAGVIFPANMAEAIAVTGIRDNLTSRCGNCHSGSKVDFVLVMQKNSNGRVPLSLADYGDTPSTVGGSSVATASTAGIAALVWAKYPGWTRTQVFNRLKSSANYFPNRHSQFGWGRINAQTATQ
ncbi:MAG: S8 family peptidase [Saprospiraceae bacterium]